MPRVSVAMSVYNGAAYLREAIDSVLAQTFADFEFIIVNDASSDATASILGSYSDPRIRILQNERNLGLAASLNRALGAASGDLIARQDADDISEPDRFAQQVAFLDRHPDTALVGSAHIEIDSSGRELARVEAHCDHVAITWAMLFFCPFAHTAVMFRHRPVLATAGAYDESYRYSMDYEYWMRIAARFRVANLPEYLVRLRMHGSSMTATFGMHTREGQRLRVDAVQRLLDDRFSLRSPEEAHALLSALIFGPPASFTADELLEAVGPLFDLQTAFASSSGLSTPEAAAHRADLRRHTGLTLLRYAQRAITEGDARGAGHLARRALVVYPRIVLQPRAALHAISLIARTTLRGRRAGRSRRQPAEPR